MYELLSLVSRQIQDSKALFRSSEQPAKGFICGKQSQRLIPPRKTKTYMVSPRNLPNVLRTVTSVFADSQITIDRETIS